MTINMYEPCYNKNTFVRNPLPFVHIAYLCVRFDSERKLRLFVYAALTNWFQCW